jgi:hypothetical protein
MFATLAIFRACTGFCGRERNMKRALAGIAIGAMLFLGSGNAAFAGEVTGNGKVTPIKDPGVAASACAFSGLEDDPIAPGTTQTPAIVAGTGIPGTACNPTAAD